MPYINESDRKRALLSPRTVGELNYAITILVQQFMDSNDGLSYARINDVMGVLESAKAEFYRRVAIPYEDKKIAANGDVYLRDYAPLPNEAMLEKAMLNVATEAVASVKRHTNTPVTNWKIVPCRNDPKLYQIDGFVGGNKTLSPIIVELDMDTGLALCTDGLRYGLTGWMPYDRLRVPVCFFEKQKAPVHVSTAERRERTTVRMMPEHLREKFGRPPHTEEPQRSIPALVKELNWGKPLSEALERALVRPGEGDALAYHNDSAHGSEFPLSRSHFDHPKAG